MLPTICIRAVTITRFADRHESESMLGRASKNPKKDRGRESHKRKIAHNKANKQGIMFSASQQAKAQKKG